MTRSWPTRSTLVIVSLAFAASAAQAQLGATVPTWPVASSDSGSSSRGIRALADVTSPLPFIGVTPCRIVDTRGPVGTFGGPSLPAGTPRNFPLPTGPCAGIPGSVSAYSLNITVTNTQGSGFIKIYPQGGPAPVVSTLNYLAGQTLANAAIVPAGTSGGVTVVAGASGTDLIIDINGYYAAAAGIQGNTFKVINSGGATVPAIWGETDSTNTNATGVFGVATATTGLTNGLWGRNFSSSDLSVGVIGVSEGTSGQTFGVYGRTNSTGSGATGTHGEALGAGGTTYGVFGKTISAANDAAGVKGIVPLALPALTGYDSAGVRGEGFLRGVLGIGVGKGVVGAAVNGTGAVVSLGYLGFGSSYGVYADIGSIACSGCTKQFVDPHPTDPSKTIHYVSLEGNEAGTYFRGTARTLRGEAVITVPEDFRMVTDEEGMTVQLTAVGAPATLYVASEDLNRIVVRSSKDVTFHYLVQGIRPAWKNFQPIQEGSTYQPERADAAMPAAWPEWTRQRLIANGTYRDDGKVNLETAQRLGWTKAWAEREAEMRRLAQEMQSEAATKNR